MKKIILLFVCLSCGRNDHSSYYKEKLVVYSLLNPAFPKQFVIVDRTYRLNEEIPETTGLSGCEVKVWKSESPDTVYFQEIVERPGFYIDTHTSPWVEPLSTYHIKVTRSDVITSPIHAYTTVPDTFSILYFSDGDTVRISDNPSLIWSKSEASAIYTVWPFFCGDTTLPLAPLATIDTIISLFSYRETFFDSVGWYIIKVFANDTNRYEWGKRLPGVEDTLDTGFGLFGSQTLDTVRLYIKK